MLARSVNDFKAAERNLLPAKSWVRTTQYMAPCGAEKHDGAGIRLRNIGIAGARVCRAGANVAHCSFHTESRRQDSTFDGMCDLVFDAFKLPELFFRDSAARTGESQDDLCPVLLGLDGQIAVSFTQPFR